MKTEQELTEKGRLRPPYNVALGIYTIIATTFVTAYTLVQIFTTI